MVVYIINRDRSPKGDKEDNSTDVASVVIEEPKHSEQGLVPIPVKQAPAALTTAIEALPSASVYSLPGGLSMRKPLGFEIAGRQTHLDHTISPQYTNLLSQPMLGTPVTAEMTSPHNAPVFTYSVQKPLSASTSDHQHTGDPTHYDFRINTDYYQDVSSLTDYGSSATSQGALPPPMHCHLSMASTNMQDMAHDHSQTPVGSRSQSSWPFRAGPRD